MTPPRYDKVQWQDWGTERLDEVDLLEHPNQQLNPECRTEAMRTDLAFRNELSENAYMYNVYTSRAVLPVSRQLAALHAVLDAEMGLAHPAGAQVLDPKAQ